MNRDHRSHATPIRPAAGVLCALAVLCLVASACTPKKINTQPAAAPSGTVRKTLAKNEVPPTPAERKAGQTGTVLSQEQASELPLPQARPRTGRPGYRTTPESVTLGLQVATLARDQLGKQYQWGASGPDRFDCSGLAHYVFGELGVNLPRVSRQQARVGQQVGRSELQPGDLVFFNLSGSSINHVGIYLDDGEFVHAPRRYEPVRIDSLNDSWWRQRFRIARRLP